MSKLTSSTVGAGACFLSPAHFKKAQTLSGRIELFLAGGPWLGSCRGPPCVLLTPARLQTWPPQCTRSGPGSGSASFGLQALRHIALPPTARGRMHDEFFHNRN
ncbi:hypothetical protein DPMN_113675 [Dreissena polymorpha]|uniref:Uncharacterized protein n=1 Tax=Dreissena polymorpha TaxID=45954 RepID=A0A9D4KIP3_DREPO|nr:hypothetical protein DPMN_113675 [Dreissena polymorpha]